MSTKIWRAYRLKKSRDLWPFVAETRRLGTERVRAKLTEIFLEFMDGVDVDSTLYKKAIEESSGKDRVARASIVNKILTRGYRISSGSFQRSYFDFNVSIGIREYKGKFYLIPYCDNALHKTLDFLDGDPRLEDYHYQNQTDKPDHIQMQDWRVRGRVWDQIFKDWDSCLTLDICHFDMYSRINPYMDVLDSLYRKDSPKTGTVAEAIRSSVSNKE